jgi:hypothetical protein
MFMLLVRGLRMVQSLCQRGNDRSGRHVQIMIDFASQILIEKHFQFGVLAPKSLCFFDALRPPLQNREIFRLS